MGSNTVAHHALPVLSNVKGNRREEGYVLEPKKFEGVKCTKGLQSFHYTGSTELVTRIVVVEVFLRDKE